jgi:hypothetical protein
LGQNTLSVFIAFSVVAVSLLFVPAGQSWGCEPPQFPISSKVHVIQIKNSSNIPLSEDEKQIFSKYEQDKSAYFLKYNQLYPCPLYESPAEISQEEKEVIESELKELRSNWQENEISEKTLKKDRVQYEEGYFEVDLNEGSYHFE